ncbi:MAG TPA: SGNH/GDSL hydrolase family protein, partial [Polyangiaceae bacterium]|nr:SGNH/GDSL hydrolase family protein [Polyangiaceae bacterium]
GAGIGAESFAELIHDGNASYFPAAEGAGEGGWNSATAFGIASPDGNGTLFDYWLRTFPGKFVCLSYGTNDGTDGSGDATGTYDNFVTMIAKVTAAGKVPVVPHVPWAEDAAHQRNATLINAKLDTLYANYPQVVKGPDLYGILDGHTEWYQDALHPNPQGEEQYRQAWANAMLASVYTAGGTSTGPAPTSSSAPPAPTSSSAPPAPTSSTAPPAPPPSGGDAAQYSFESGTQGWAVGGSTSSLSTSTTTVYAGKESLQAVFENSSSSAQTFTVAVDPGSTVTGAANIALHFWYPVNSGITYVQAFAQQQASPWTMYSPASVASTPGAWNAWTISVPASAIPLQAIALQFVLGGGASATVYVDSVSW